MSRPPAGLMAVLLLTLVVRIAACCVWADNLTRDRDVYLGIAQQVAAGHGFCSPGSTGPTAYRPPLYPLLLALPLLVFPAAVAAAAVNTLAGLVAVAATWSIARRTGVADRAATAAALLLAVDPLLVRYTAQPMTECVFAALTIAALWSLQASRERERPECSALGAGVLLGLAALCRPTIWPFIAVIIVVATINGARGGSRNRKRGLLAAARYVISLWIGVTVIVAPWAIRNAIAFGKPIITTTHGGYTLLLANNPVFYEVARQPWGTVWAGDSLERWQHEMLDRAAQELGPDAGEVTLDRWQAAQARQFMLRDPSGFFSAGIYRVRSLWSLSPRGEAASGSGPARLIAVWYGALFVLAAWGAWNEWRRDARWAAVLLLFVASIQAVHLVYWTDTRMRAPLHPVLALLAVQVRRTGELGRPARSVASR